MAAQLIQAFGRHLHQAMMQRDSSIVDLLGYDVAECAFTAFQLRSREIDLIEWLDIKGVVEDIGVPTALRIARCWGDESPELLEQNPYLLMTFLPWKIVDAIGRRLGIAPDDPRRAIAAIEAVLYTGLDRNNTLQTVRDVEASAAKLLNGVAALAGSQAEHLVDLAVYCGAASRIGNGLQPFGAAVMEEEIASWVATASKSLPYHDLVVRAVDVVELEQRIARFDSSQPHPLTKQQKCAITSALLNRVMVLAGYAGSGKTASLRGICDISGELGREVHLMALSGRAAQRMSAATGRPARTIAGFLNRLSQADDNPLAPGAMLIIDEASMLDLPTFWRIVRVVGEANIILAGDPAQLPPIGFGLVFHILYQAKGVPRVILDRVLRQAVETGIPSIADQVRNGIIPSFDRYAGLQDGVSFIAAGENEAINHILDIGRDLSSAGSGLGDTQIISAIKSGPAGIRALNEYFHNARRHMNSTEGFPRRPDISAGDPIIWTKNDWDRDLMNGSMGRLHSVINGIGHATIDGKPFELTQADAEYLDLAYAISVHKAQGSQWPRIILPVFPSRLLDRALLYTAITRASHQVIIIGDRDALEHAIETPPRSFNRSVGLGLRMIEIMSGGERCS